jgi:hypothetical protein
MDESETITDRIPNRAEGALEAVAAKFGADGVSAVALFMHLMGRDARLSWPVDAGPLIQTWVEPGQVIEHSVRLGGMRP